MAAAYVIEPSIKKEDDNQSNEAEAKEFKTKMGHDGNAGCIHKPNPKRKRPNEREEIEEEKF